MVRQTKGRIVCKIRIWASTLIVTIESPGTAHASVNYFVLEDAGDFLCILYIARDSSSSAINHHSIIRLPRVTETSSSSVPLLISVLKTQAEITWQGGDNRGPDNSVSCILGERR